MALIGNITLEDINISFHGTSDLKVKYTITDLVTGEVEFLIAGQYAFFAALSIAVHNDGYGTEEDYAIAESIQGKIRWIP